MALRKSACATSTLLSSQDQAGGETFAEDSSQSLFVARRFAFELSNEMRVGESRADGGPILSSCAFLPYIL